MKDKIRSNQESATNKHSFIKGAINASSSDKRSNNNKRYILDGTDGTKISDKTVPSYALYGTQALADDPGFLHIETLATSSLPYAGHIKPHRHKDLFQILLLQKGSAQVQIDRRQMRLSQPTVITLPPGYVHAFNFFEETDGFILTLALPLLSDAAQTDRFSFMAMDPQLIPLDRRSLASKQIEQLIEMMALELTQPDSWRTEICGHLVRALLIWLQRATLDLDKLGSDRAFSLLLNDFRHLIEMHYTEHLSVARYADLLGSSVASLNRHTQRHLGVSAQALVHQRVNQEAKRSLSFTQRALEQIALELGFDDPAYFSRFFKRLNACTPSEFRRNNNFGTESLNR